MADLTATLSAVGTLKATLGAGKINVNDYTLTVEAVENGTNISITRGSQTDTVFVPDYAEDETERKTAEEGRVAAETERVTAEDARAAAETARENAETARADADTKRADAETARATAEAGRDAAETARVDSESKRVTAESARETAEAARQAAEEKRVDAETARAAAETSRVSAETARATAEDARAKTESQRQTDTVAAISKADAAAESAQSVADTVQAKLDAGELDGYSPSASVTQTDTGATISITDKSGTSTADVKNGSDAAVTKNAVISALGYAPEVDIGSEWTKIWSAEITEDGIARINTIWKNVKKLLFVATLPEAPSDDGLFVRVWQRFGDNTVNISAFSFRTTYVYAIYQIENGILHREIYCSANNDSSLAAWSATHLDVTDALEHGYAKSIYAFDWRYAPGLPVGTKIAFYGIL